jgi:hypothetical protein
MEEKRFPPLPPTLQELDEANAALTGGSTLTNRREEYEAVQAALDEEFPDRPLKRIDPSITAIEQRIDAESVATDPTSRDSNDEHQTREAFQGSTVEKQLEAGRKALETFRAALLPSPEQAAGLPKSPRNPVSKLPEPVTPLRTGVVRAPKPPSEVGGFGVYHGSKTTVVPSDLPPYYPASLEIGTRIILAKAAQKYPEQSQAAQMCKYIISEVTPHRCSAVSNSGEKPESVLLSVAELLRFIREQNCFASEKSQVEQNTLKSAEWLALLTELERVKIGTHKIIKNAQPANGFDHSDDYRSIRFDGEGFILTPNQALVVEALHEAHKQGTYSIESVPKTEQRCMIIVLRDIGRVVPTPFCSTTSRP